ncbi:transposase, partial [Salmonella enterica]|nr:transposase [Salmonella enterica]ELQ0030148.1 IS66 family insertion sequence element accessory protein TnpB [Salmonella enterica]
RHGVWLCARRLHRGRFIWPRDGDSTWSLTPEQFDWLVSGIDWQKMSGHDLTKWT